MADDTAKADLEEVKKKLDGLLGVVQGKKEESQSSGTPWGWVAAAIAAILAFVGLAFAAYDAWKKGREIAKLKHEIDVQEEMKIQAEIRVKLAAEEKLQKAQILIVEQLAKQIAQTKAQILLVEQERQEVHAKIDKVTSWVDIDKLMGG
jgi:uncharacterized protein HemX